MDHGELVWDFPADIPPKIVTDTNCSETHSPSFINRFRAILEVIPRRVRIFIRDFVSPKNGEFADSVGRIKSLNTLDERFADITHLIANSDELHSLDFSAFYRLVDIYNHYLYTYKLRPTLFSGLLFPILDSDDRAQIVFLFV